VPPPAVVSPGRPSPVAGPERPCEAARSVSDPVVNVRQLV